jgi:hypothetical protein
VIYPIPRHLLETIITRNLHCVISIVEVEDEKGQVELMTVGVKLRIVYGNEAR